VGDKAAAELEGGNAPSNLREKCSKSAANAGARS